MLYLNDFKQEYSETINAINSIINRIPKWADLPDIGDIIYIGESGAAFAGHSSCLLHNAKEAFESNHTEIMQYSASRSDDLGICINELINAPLFPSSIVMDAVDGLASDALQDICEELEGSDLSLQDLL